MGIITVIFQIVCFQALSAVFIIVFSLITDSVQFSEGTIIVNVNNTNPGVYYSLKSILEELNSKKYENNPNVQTLLKTFQTNFYKRNRKTLANRIHPFIVVEGMNRTWIHEISKSLADNLGAKLLFTHPNSLSRMRHMFNNGDALERMYNFLCTYETSFFVRSLLPYTPVVYRCYWMYQAASLLAFKYVGGLPPHNSSLFTFPKDLLKPDIVFFSAKLEKLKVKQSQRLWYKRFAEAYRGMGDPGVHELRPVDYIEPNLMTVRRVMREELGLKFNHLNYL